MNFIITLILLLLILSFIVFIHEFGHFLMAKKAGIYVDEFALGMGPKIWSFKRKKKKDPTTYSIRLFPIGGFVAMANTADEGYKIKKSQILENKNFFQKTLVLLMGIIFNCILAFVIFFFNGLIFGSPETSPYIGAIQEKSPASFTNLKEGDLILKVNDKKMYSWDDVLLEISVKELKSSYTFIIEHENGTEESITFSPNVTKTEEGIETRSFGLGTAQIKYDGIFRAIEYAFNESWKSIRTLFVIIGNLFTGDISLNNLSGPVGIFSVVDTVKANGLENLLYLIGYLSLNVAIINLIPIPVFDGGRYVLVLIEVITRKKTNPKLESILNMVGFGLLILLMIFVTFNDIIKLF